MHQRQRSSTPSTKRLDLQGLRAVAVGLVVLEHVSGAPVGGFIGVDVFFVLSGFLITGGLLAEHRRTGRMSLLGFAARRARRLLPAALTVLAVGIVAATAFLPARRAADAAVDGLWSGLSLANWHFAAKQADYFAAKVESPFQHFWSLSVEEQFYVVLPMLLLALLAIGGRRHGRTTAFAVLAGLVVASFLFALSLTGSDPSGAYFSSPARAWELGVGSLLAFGASVWVTIPRRAGLVLSWGGLATIITTALLVDGSSMFPGPLAVLPVVGAAAVIVGGAAAPVSSAAPLRSRPMTTLGDISYSLYLWHFPVLVVVVGVDDQLGWLAYPLGLALAAVSYHLIERPFMSTPFSSVLRAVSRQKTIRSAGRREWASWFRSLGRPFRSAAAGALATCTAVLVLAAADRAQPIEAPLLQPETSAVVEDAAQVPEVSASDASGPEVSGLQGEIRAALTATSWPELDEDPAGTVVGGTHLPCGDIQDIADPASCTFGNADAPKTMMLVGDSTAVHELDALIEVVGRHDDWRLTSRSGFGCPFMSAEIRGDAAADCRTYKEDTIAQIDATKPDLLVVTNTFGPIPLDGTNRDMRASEWATSVAESLDRVKGKVGAVVHITPPPVGGDLATCYQPDESPADCATRAKGQWKTRLAALERIADERAQRVVDTRDLFCVDDLCPSFVASTLVKIDAVHMTGAYAKKIGPALDEILVSAKVFG